jgi:hypothetical protein
MVDNSITINGTDTLIDNCRFGSDVADSFIIQGTAERTIVNNTRSRGQLVLNGPDNCEFSNCVVEAQYTSTASTNCRFANCQFQAFASHASTNESMKYVNCEFMPNNINLGDGSRMEFTDCQFAQVSFSGNEDSCKFVNCGMAELGSMTVSGSNHSFTNVSMTGCSEFSSIGSNHTYDGCRFILGPGGSGDIIVSSSNTVFDKCELFGHVPSGSELRPTTSATGSRFTNNNISVQSVRVQSSDTLISHNEIDTTSQITVEVTAHSNIFESNLLYNLGGGMSIFGGDFIMSNCKVPSNIVANTTATGIQITNCQFYQQGRSTFHARHPKVSNSLFVNNPTDSFVIQCLTADAAGTWIGKTCKGYTMATVSLIAGSTGPLFVANRGLNTAPAGPVNSDPTSALNVLYSL